LAIQEHSSGLSLALMSAHRLWAVGLVLYALVAVSDMGQHLYQAGRAGQSWYAPSDLVVAFSAGLFWPADLIARQLLN
jgi:hypothetical protein